MTPPPLALLRTLLWSLVTLAAWNAASGEEFPIASESRLHGDETRTRFVLDLTRSIEVVAFTLADPYRVVVDLPQVVFRLPPKTGEVGRGLIKAFRFGLVVQGGSRIVLDTTGPVKIDKAFVLVPVEGQPARLVVDLIPVDRDAFLRNLATENAARYRSRAPAGDQHTPIDPRPLIVLDPGHGGIDHGASVPGGPDEKTITLDFAHLLRQNLEARGKYRVAMTRSDDRYIPLPARVTLARTQQAALFISIHVDALEKRDTEARGATVYTLSDKASDEEAARLAQRENRAIAGVDLSAEPEDIAEVLIDLAQRETKAFALNFADMLVRELGAVSPINRNPIRSAGFRVLEAPDIPSVLIELGYLTNRRDLEYLTSNAWRSRAAESAAQAVMAFFADRVNRSSAGN